MNQDNLNELFTWAIRAGQNRQYFLNIKQDRKGDLYLVIKETKRNQDGEKEVHRIMIFEKDLDNFVTGIKEVLHFINNFEKRPANFANNSYPNRDSQNQQAPTIALASDLDDDFKDLMV